MSNKMKVKVIDSKMGTGKTSWAIQYMNEADTSEKFIFITPFLNEVDRIKTSVTGREFIQPESFKGKNKKQHLKKLIAEGKDIVSTHALFKKADEALVELIEMEGYTLILDEVMNVIEQEHISKDDLTMLREYYMDIDEETGFCTWRDSNYEGRFLNIKRLAESGNLMVHNNTALYWTFPVEAFRAFHQVICLTYMFDGQLQKYYYDMFNVEYFYKAIRREGDRFKLVNYVNHEQEDRDQLRELINIHYSKLNDVGKNQFAFSSTRLEKWSTNKEYEQTKKKIKNNAYNFYRNKCQAPTEGVMWTTIKGDKDKIKNALAPAKAKKQFVEVTARATNDYRHKFCCIYLANRFMNPMLKSFVEDKGAEVDQDKFALSEMLQWLFRSRIRENQPIDVYIPSSRMRKLLEMYLNNEM
ncbi:DEAD/DEAH box helicase family protein [Halobacillus kuroshimensis]|uniref:DEAD/DEAH box helicase family protein n=1 Tax=Halobacillus kuroshimensis TaxID=302481 RepID=A0ABS3DTS0_9BACI|nr:DEAD/DEAH box helicase family protein [Halobacillus kuroshimensis]MBN8234719.1 DEAD/DEAH box helicase family protein [Halobacillus kuroshimensis]